MKGSRNTIQITVWHDYGILGITLGTVLLLPAIFICLGGFLQGIELLVIVWLIPVGGILILMGVKDLNKPTEYVMLFNIRSHSKNDYMENKISEAFREHAISIVEEIFRDNDIRYIKSTNFPIQKRFSRNKITQIIEIPDREIKIYLGKAKSYVSTGISIRIESKLSKNKYNIKEIESIIDKGLFLKINSGRFAGFRVEKSGIDLV